MFSRASWLAARSRGDASHGMNARRFEPPHTARPRDERMMVRASPPEVRIPSSDAFSSPAPEDACRFGEVAPGEPPLVGEREGIEPELRDVCIDLDVDMARLGSFVAVEEEPEPSSAEDGRHQDLFPELVASADGPREGKEDEQRGCAPQERRGAAKKKHRARSSITQCEIKPPGRGTPSEKSSQTCFSWRPLRPGGLIFLLLCRAKP